MTRTRALSGASQNVSLYFGCLWQARTGIPRRAASRLAFFGDPLMTSLTPPSACSRATRARSSAHAADPEDRAPRGRQIAGYA